MVYSKESKATTDGAEGDVPKKCVQIKKKRVSSTLEKVEVRYVAYNRVDKDSFTTTMEALSDAAKYFEGRHGELDFQNDTSCEVTVQKEDKNKLKLESCLPVLLSLRARFAETESMKEANAHKRTGAGALKSLCDEIIAEASYVLENGHPVTGVLIKKIANINTLSRQVLTNESKLDESLVPDENELAASKSKTSDKFK